MCQVKPASASPRCSTTSPCRLHSQPRRRSRGRPARDRRARDSAYHQGTVWPWLIGPFIDAWLKLHPDDRAGARRFLEGSLAELTEGCVGSLSEIHDAEPPYTPRGCFAQAWSVSETLRAYHHLARSQTHSRARVAERAGGRK